MRSDILSAGDQFLQLGPLRTLPENIQTDRRFQEAHGPDQVRNALDGIEAAKKSDTRADARNRTAPA